MQKLPKTARVVVVDGFRIPKALQDGQYVTGLGEGEETRHYIKQPDNTESLPRDQGLTVPGTVQTYNKGMVFVPWALD